MKIQHFNFRLCLAISIVIVVYADSICGQDYEFDRDACKQPNDQRQKLIDEAEQKQYWIHWIYISGNTYTRHRDFRKKMHKEFEQGFIFKRTALEDSVKQIAKMKSIYPITLDDVLVQLDHEKKEVNVTFCVKQKQKR